MNARWLHISWQLLLLVVTLVTQSELAFSQITVSPTPVPKPELGVPYNVTLTGSGGIAPYTFVATTGHLPLGVALGASGTLSGIAPISNSFNYTIIAADINGREGTLTSTGTTTSIALVDGAPTVFGQTTSLTATVTGNAPSGSVAFCADGSVADMTFCASGALLCTSSLSPITATTSVATCNTASLNVGTHTITTAYAGDSNNSAAKTANAVTHLVNKATSTITITMLAPPGPITIGSSVTVSVTAIAIAPGAGTLTGSVTISDGAGATCLLVLTAGTGSCLLTPNTPGSKSITGQYAGDSNFLGSTSNTVILSVTPPAHTITANGGPNGAITPATQYVVDGSNASFTVTPATGYTPNIDGTCPVGTLNNGVYTTGTIVADCTVTVSFASAATVLSLLVTDNHAYARYGMLLNYIVTVSNNTGASVSGLTISSNASPGLDVNSSHWLCVGSNAQCTAQGQGILVDNSVTVPARGSVSWVVTAPVLSNTADVTVSYAVNLNGASFATPLTQVDNDILVIYRDGFDTPHGDGAQSLLPTIAATTATHWDGNGMLIVNLPSTVNSMIESVLSASASDTSGFSIERLTSANQSWLRLVTIDTQGKEHASSWTRMVSNAQLVLDVANINDQRVLLLIGAEREIDMQIDLQSGPWQVGGTAQIVPVRH